MTARPCVGCPFRRDCPDCPWSGEIPAARIETGDTLPTMPEMHIGFRPEESP